MILELTAGLRLGLGAPRTSGDDPDVIKGRYGNGACSPHERG